MRAICKNIFFCVCGFGMGIVFIIYRCGYILENKQKMADRYYSYYMLMERWLSGKENGNKFNQYFIDNDIHTVAIYGMGKIGQHLKYELDRNGIQTAYVIDEGENVIYGKEKHYNLQEQLPLVDAIIVTPIMEFAEIKNRIFQNNKMIKVISIEEIVC